MLIFIGGAARAGKGILAQRLLAERRLPNLNLDVLKMGLARGVPEYDIDPDAGAYVVGDRLWPLVREMSMTLLVEGIDYVLEGELLPQHVATLQEEFPRQVRSCFLGYVATTPEQKLHAIRTHTGHPNDWPRDYNDADLLRVITREIAFSHAVQIACAQHGLRYFDTSTDFVGALDRAFAYLTHPGR